MENNNSYHRGDNEYGYALFRDELKAQDDCNPDINIEMDGKESNPHWTKYKDIIIVILVMMIKDMDESGMKNIN